MAKAASQTVNILSSQILQKLADLDAHFFSVCVCVCVWGGGG